MKYHFILKPTCSLFLILAILFQFASCANNSTPQEQSKDILPAQSTAQATIQILIAAEQTAYKDAIVNALINHFDEKQILVKTIGLSELKKMDIDQWDAICLIHSWQKGKPVKQIRSFFKQAPNLKKLAVLTTSQKGDKQLNEVDAITGASVIEEVPVKVKLLIEKLEDILEREV